jgi:hypothetical protein
LATGCFHDGQGWRFEIRTGGFTIDWTSKPNSVGEFYNKTSFDPAVWRSFTEWWEDGDETKRQALEHDIDLLLAWLPEDSPDHLALLKMRTLLASGAPIVGVAPTDDGTMQPIN